MPNLYVTLFHIMKSSTNLILTERERKIILLLNDPITIDTIIITCKKQTSITSRSEYVYVYVCVCVFVRVQFNLFRIYIFPMIKLSSIDNHYYFVKNSIILFL